MGMFSGKDVPAVGISIGIERVFKILQVTCSGPACIADDANARMLNSLCSVFTLVSARFGSQHRRNVDTLAALSLPLSYGRSVVNQEAATAELALRLFMLTGSDGSQGEGVWRLHPVHGHGCPRHLDRQGPAAAAHAGRKPAVGSRHCGASRMGEPHALDPTLLQLCARARRYSSSARSVWLMQEPGSRVASLAVICFGSSLDSIIQHA